MSVHHDKLYRGATIDQAYERGRSDYLYGRTFFDCPYAKKESQDSWERGFAYEREKARKGKR